MHLDGLTQAYIEQIVFPMLLIVAIALLASFSMLYATSAILILCIVPFVNKVKRELSAMRAKREKVVPLKNTTVAMTAIQNESENIEPPHLEKLLCTKHRKSTPL